MIHSESILKRTSPFTIPFTTILLGSVLTVVPNARAGEPTCESRPMVMYVGGEMDDFAAPYEPTTRSVELETRYSVANWKEFDDPTINRNLGHSFEGLPSRITAATLEVRAKAGGSNDRIYFHHDAGTPTLWFSDFHDLPGTGGTWDPFNNPDPITFTFDLDALPGPTSILDQIAAAKRFDVVLQDDTAIDYMKLTVWYHPVEVYRVGRPDNFAAPTDPTSPSATLRALRSAPFDWKDMDDGRANFGVGHTFTGLPTGIVEASLEIRMRPHTDAPSNDTLSLAYDGLAGSFVYGSRIHDLPESGGSWNNGQGAATFHIDLDALPEGSALLAHMNGNRRLDLYVQDDTAVDYAVLRLRSCPPRRRVAGVSHSAFGNADILEHGSRSFTLTNLGAGGDDGARIELGEAKGWGFTLVDPLDVPGSSRSWTMRGNVDGVLDQPIFTETWDVLPRDGGTRVQVSHDHSPQGAAQMRARFYGSDGALLHDTTLDNGPMYEFDFTFEPPPFVVQWDNTCVVRPIPPLAAVDVADGASLVDVAKIELEAVTPTKSVEFCSAVESRGTNLSSARIEDEIFILWDCPMWIAGRPALEIFGNTLTVSEVGTSGRDGVAFGLDGADAVLLDLLPIDPNDEAIVGSLLRIDATGERGGSPDQDLGSLTVTKTASDAFEHQTDFSSLATSQQRIQVLRAGVVVEERVVPTTSSVMSSRWPDRLGKLGGTTECYVSQYPPDTLFTLPLLPLGAGASRGAAGIVGDELRLLAEGGDAVSGKSSFIVRSAGLGSFTIENAVVEPDLAADVLFTDGFESGDLIEWSLFVP